MYANGVHKQPKYFLHDILSQPQLGIIMIIFSVLMALSRIYVCVHYPTDVASGLSHSSRTAASLCEIPLAFLAFVVTGMVIYPKLYSINNNKDTLS